MRGDLHPVAFRLSTELPSRINYAKPRPYVQSEFSRKRRPLHINGKEYSSVNEAAKCLKVSSRRLYTLMERGEIKDGEENHIQVHVRGRPKKYAQSRTEKYRVPGGYK